METENKNNKNVNDATNDTGDELETDDLAAEVGTPIVRTEAMDPSTANCQPVVLLSRLTETELTRGKRGRKDQPDDPRPEYGPKVSSARRGRSAVQPRGIKGRRCGDDGNRLPTIPEMRERSPVIGGRSSPTLAPSDSILEVIIKEAHAIIEEARKSGNLSGKVHGRINRACREIMLGAENLQSREEIDEMRVLKADNKRMREQLAHLEAETKALRTAFSNRRAEPQPEPTEGQLSTLLKSALAEMKEELRRDIIISTGEMMNARLDDIRQRLPPEPILRPPLAADRKAAEAAARLTEQSAARPSTSAEAPTPAPAASKAQRKPKKRGPPAGSTPPSSSSPSATQPTAAPQRLERPDAVLPPSLPLRPSAQPQAEVQEEGTWSSVVGRKAKNKAKKAATRAAMRAAPTPKPRRRELAVPATAGIVVALRSESEATYASILTKATTSFSLAEFGLEHVRVRKTADGARILEVSNADGGRAANCLREKLEGLIGEDAIVYRPVKMAGLRVSGLMETVTPEAVAAAIATKGGCGAEEVRVGSIRIATSGSGSTLVRCPLVVAKRVCEEGRLVVGWSSALVQALDPTPLRCYKCMGAGHTRATCPSEVERGDLCFRCSKPGHRAASCSEAPFCAVCHHGRRPAGHVMGGQACNPPQVRGRPNPVRTTGHSHNNAEQAGEGQQMDL